MHDKSKDSKPTEKIEQRVQEALELLDSRSQMSESQVEWIIRQSGSRLDGSMLVFGLGHDSLMWSKISETTFLEDRRKWYRKFYEESPHLRLLSYLVNYTTQVRDWQQDLLSHKTNTIPQEVDARRFDVILIDGPRGFRKSCPGRVSPILHARRLIRDSGMIFIDDMDRTLEKKVSQCVLGEPLELHKDRSAIGCWLV